MSSFYDVDTFDYVKEHVVQEKKKLSLNGELFRVYCCGHYVSLMAQYAFGEVQVVIEKMRQLYNPKSGPLWYLTSFKLKNTLELWSIGEFSSKDVTDNYDVPSAEEWKKVEEVCNIVDRIYEVADGIFHKEHVTAKGMLEKLDEYLNDMFMVLAIATVLDPQFKMKYIEFTCSEVWGTDGISKAKAVSEAFDNLFDDYATRFAVKAPSSSSSSISMQGYQKFIRSQNRDVKSELMVLGTSSFALERGVHCVELVVNLKYSVPYTFKDGSRYFGYTNVTCYLI